MSCVFFEGTVELASTDHENAEYVSLLMAEAMVRIGPLSIVQIVTDTCAVMQARVPAAAPAVAPAVAPPVTPLSPARTPGSLAL